MKTFQLTEDRMSIRLKGRETVEITTLALHGVTFKTFVGGFCELRKSAEAWTEKCFLGEFSPTEELVFYESAFYGKLFVENLTKGMIYISVSKNEKTPVIIPPPRIIEGELSSNFPKENKYLQENFSLKPGEASPGIVLNSPGFIFSLVVLQGKGKIFPDCCFELERAILDATGREALDTNFFKPDKEYFVRNVYVEGVKLDFVVFKSKKIEEQKRSN